MRRLDAGVGSDVGHLGHPAVDGAAPCEPQQHDDREHERNHVAVFGEAPHGVQGRLHDADDERRDERHAQRVHPPDQRRRKGRDELSAFVVHTDLLAWEVDFARALRAVEFINKTLENESRIDSLIDLLKVYKSASPTGELYYLARTAFGKIERLQYNRRTYDQLKSSGSLRLIHHQGVLDSISKYFESLQWIDLQNQLQIERQTIYAVQLGEIFDAWTIDSVFNTNFSKPTAAPSLLTTDKRDLNRFVMRLHILKGVVLFNLRRVVNDYLPNAKKLIALIKEEYSIDE